MAIAILVGGSAVSEQQQTAAIYAAGAARVVVVLGVIVFAAIHIERLIETREIEAILSHAISRSKFLIGYWLGLSLVVASIIAPVGALVAWLAIERMGALLWTASMLMEGLIVVAFAMFAGLTFARSVPTVFATVGFYALARSLGFLTGITSSVYRSQTGTNEVLNPYIDFLALVLPRLDLFSQSAWLIYDLEPVLIWILPVQTLLYVALLLFAADFDLRRRRF